MSVTSQGVHLHKLAQLFPAIADLIVDDAVTEIMVTSHPSRGVLVFFEKKGKLYRAPLTGINKSDVLSFCNAASRPLGSNLKEEALIDARLADGSRVAIAVPPASPNGPAVTIRRFAKVAYTGMDLVSFGSLPKEVFDLLVHSLTHGCNVLVAGGTGSGKTTLLNALLAEFPENDRLVVIEDVIELKVEQPNVVRLEARSGPDGPLSARRMVKHALRQRPDHIILGEIRGQEAYDVLQALNTGHGGSMTTIHANSAENALLRLASCALEGTDMPWSVVAANVSMAFDLVVHQERRADRSRGVSQVIRVKGYDRVREAWDVETVWRYTPSEKAGAAANVPVEVVSAADVDAAEVAAAGEKARPVSPKSDSSSPAPVLVPPAVPPPSVALVVVSRPSRPASGAAAPAAVAVSASPAAPVGSVPGAVALAASGAVRRAAAARRAPSRPVAPVPRSSSGAVPGAAAARPAVAGVAPPRVARNPSEGSQSRAVPPRVARRPAVSNRALSPPAAGLAPTRDVPLDRASPRAAEGQPLGPVKVAVNGESIRPKAASLAFDRVPPSASGVDPL